MSFTRRYLDFLSEGFKSIGRFAFAPFYWALNGFGEEKSDSNHLAEVVEETPACYVCNSMVCCCRAPLACTGELFTLSLSCTAGLLLGLVGGAGIPFAAAADAVKDCVKGYSNRDNTSGAEECTDGCSNSEEAAASADIDTSTASTSETSALQQTVIHKYPGRRNTI